MFEVLYVGIIKLHRGISMTEEGYIRERAFISPLEDRAPIHRRRAAARHKRNYMKTGLIEPCKTISRRFSALCSTTKRRLSSPDGVKSRGSAVYASPSYPPQSNEAESLAMNSHPYSWTGLWDELLR